MAVNATSCPGEDILHPTARNMFAVWDTIRQGRSAPCRNELDLRSIKKLLPNVALIERHPLKFEFTFRLAGTGLRGIFGRELTGMDFLSIWAAVERPAIGDLASDVIVRHKPSSIRFKGFTADGRAETIELLMLPLLPSRRNSTYILATLTPMAEPYWLGDYPIVRTEMISLRSLLPEPLAEPSEAPLAEQPSTLATTPEAHVKAPQLQLIRGGIQ